MSSNIGIKAIEVFFPDTFVNQSELEDFYGVEKGKYTIGLGQQNMSFSNNRLDVNAIALTVTESLMDKYNISFNDIGRVEVGTESSVDKSKSVKTVLMDLFAKHNNYNIEGTDCINACYGGTQAIFNSIAWLQSPECKNRYAIVVMADIAVYPEGPARPTGGCGGIAVLLGPDAPIIFEEGTRHSYMDNVYDFYKPVLNSQYPVVDGELSNNTYLDALYNCYKGYSDNKNDNNLIQSSNNYFIFHTPYCKLIKKSIAYLVFKSEMPENNSTYNKIIEKKFIKKSENIFLKTDRSLILSKQLGNTYTASLWLCLVSLINNSDDNLLNKNIIGFSYGSGMTSTMFGMKVIDSVKYMKQNINLESRLLKRLQCNVDYFHNVLQENDDLYDECNILLSNNLKSIPEDGYYLSKIKEGKRSYLKNTNLILSKL